MSDDARRHRVALLARRLRLIARRPELQANKQADRVARALPDDAPGYLPLLDAVQIIGAGETDRLCGYAVRLLSQPKGRTAEILDLLSMLSPDRVCAIYYAVPDARRAAIRRDVAFRYHVEQLGEMRAALAWADEPQPATSQHAAAALRSRFGTTAAPAGAA